MAPASKLPARVSVYEVSPRDGLQNESAQVATHAKVRLVDALVDAGIRRIEVGSFEAGTISSIYSARALVKSRWLSPENRGVDSADA